MAGPFIFIATNRLKPGKLDAERARVPGLVEFIKTAEPRLFAFNEYSNEEGTEVAVVQVHPDTDSLVFGSPTPRIMEMLRQAAGAGVRYRVNVHHLGGFTRIGAASSRIV